MDYKIRIDYLGGVLTDNNYKFRNRGTKWILR